MRCLSQVPVVHAVEAAVLVIGFSERQFFDIQGVTPYRYRNGGSNGST